MTRSEIKFILRKKKKNASVSSISLNLKPPYDIEVVAKPYPLRMSLHNLEVRWKARKMREHIVRFIDSVGAHANDVALHFKLEFLHMWSG